VALPLPIHPFLPLLTARGSRAAVSTIAPPAGPGGTRPPNTFWCNSQPKICKSITVLPTCTKHLCNVFMTFSGIHILTPPVDPGRVRLRWTLVAYFAVKFFINGGINQPVFANVGSSSTSSQIKNSAVVDKLRNATATPFRTDSDDH